MGLMNSFWKWLQGDPATIAIVVLAALILHVVLMRSIKGVERVMQGEKKATALSMAVLSATGIDSQRRAKRAATVSSLLRSIASLLVITVTALTVLSIMGVPLTPVLASAGVGGVAIGIGAQSLVRDFLSGVFMIIEDQYGVGDLVDLGDARGTVEEVTLRVTRVRDMHGVIWYVRNGEITRVANSSQGFSTVVIDIPVSPQTDTASALEVLEDVCSRCMQDPEIAEMLLGSPQVLGVESVTAGAINLRFTAETPAGSQFALSRVLRKLAVESLRASGVDLAHGVLPGNTNN